MLSDAIVTTDSYRPDDAVQDDSIGFAVIAARYQGKWILCRHRSRQTWECPGGHREPGETPIETARRELFEETGAEEFAIVPVCVYHLDGISPEGSRSNGLLCRTEITRLGEKPESEIAQIRLSASMPDPEQMTYPTVDPLLMEICEKQ